MTNCLMGNNQPWQNNCYVHFMLNYQLLTDSSQTNVSFSAFSTVCLHLGKVPYFPENVREIEC